MKLILFCISIIEFLIILYLIFSYSKKIKRFDIQEYEFLILNIARKRTRELLEYEDCSIEEVINIIVEDLYSELQLENIIIKCESDDRNIREYIRNIIYMNNLLIPDNKEESEDDYEDYEIDYDKRIPLQNNSQNTKVKCNIVSIADEIRSFYD